MVYTSGERVKEIVRIFTKYGLSYIVDKKNKKDKKSKKGGWQWGGDVLL